MTSHEPKILLWARQAMARAVGMGCWLLASGLLLFGAQPARAEIECKGRVLPIYNVPGQADDLKVTGTCWVQAGQTSYFKNVNVLDGGILIFREPRTGKYANALLGEFDHHRKPRSHDR